MGQPLIDIVGQKFGKLLILHRVKDRYAGSTKHLEVWYRVLCDCGKKQSMRGYMIRYGRVRDCKNCRPGSNFKHGLSNTREYRIWHTTKSRAREEGIKFNLDVRDIKIPKICPLLGIPIVLNNKKTQGNGPSIDRFNPKKGYIKGNVWVISHKANTIKSNATIEELKLLAKNLEDSRGLFIS